MRTVLLLPLALLALGAVAQDPAPKPRFFTETSADKTVRLKVGEKFSVVLKANPSTGYGWSAPTFEPEGVVTLRKSVYVPLKKKPGELMVGTGGHQVLLLTAAEEGTTVLKTGYSQPWMKDTKPARTYSVTLVIEPEE